MSIVRGILYIAAAIIVAGAAEGLSGNKLGLHHLLAALPVYPDSPILALALGLGIFALAEYVSYSSGEPPVILHVAAFLARVLLLVSAILCLTAIVGLVVSILAATGPLSGLKESFPPAFLYLHSAWLAAFAWFGVLLVSSFLAYRLNPRFAAPGKQKYPAWLKADEFEAMWEQEHRPEEAGGKMGPVMRLLTTRGIRPIYFERPTLEPLGRLAGEVGLINVFVDCPSATWPDDEIMRTLHTVRGALRWLEKEATGKAELHFKDIGHLRAPTPGWPAIDHSRLSPRELKWQVVEILGGIGIEGLDDLHYYLMRYSDEPGNIALFHFYLRAGSWCLPHLHPNVGIVYCFHRHDPELTRPHFLDEGDLRVFPELSSIYGHFILHLFGASDKPMRNVYPHIDIMSAVAFELDDLLIGFKTAKEIGW